MEKIMRKFQAKLQVFVCVFVNSLFTDYLFYLFAYFSCCFFFNPSYISNHDNNLGNPNNPSNTQITSTSLITQ
jgi:hypothetical protein